MPNGLVLVTPTSVTAGGSSTATILPTGSVDYGGVTSTSELSINGVFTSTYRNYLMYHYYSLSGTQNSITHKLRASGTNSVASYDVQWVGTLGTSTLIGRTTNLSVSYGGEGTFDRGGDVTWIYGPQLSERTTMTTECSGARGGAMLYWTTCVHRVATSYDGITIAVGSGATLAGNIAIYGFNQ